MEGGREGHQGGPPQAPGSSLPSAELWKAWRRGRRAEEAAKNEEDEGEEEGEEDGEEEGEEGEAEGEGVEEAGADYEVGVGGRTP